MYKKEITYTINYTHFGEIIQGIFNIISKKRCAVTLPIYIGNKKKKKILFNDLGDNFKFAELNCRAEYKKSKKRYKLSPKNYVKSYKLGHNILKKYNKSLFGKIKIVNKIPISKGLGSSTSNMIAVAKIIKKIFNLNLNNNKILKLCCEIEPTDPILKKNISLFSTIEGEIKKKLKFKIPNLVIYGFDTAAKKKGVNTIKMGQPKYTKSELNFFNHSILKLSSQKIYEKNLINKISKKSLLINQKHVPKKKLDYLLNVEKKMSNDFIIGAHSGTMIGFAYNYNKLLKNKMKKIDLKILNKISSLYKTPIKKYFYV
tara:strand:- start:886 stop:1830 length:945 start_codon:yes stop_codon:yes gene_type:complete